MLTWIQDIILGIVEGLTEFLPVSSTGHLMVATSLMGIPSDDFIKTFTVAIQFGAILSVIVLYWKRFFKSFDFYFKLFIAFLPAAVIGLLCIKYIDSLLGNVMVVIITLFIGGVVLVFIDRWFKDDAIIPDKDVTHKNALVIGFFQVVSMIPGVSRAAATIIGGLTQKLNRKTAVEFSFFLAVPTMFAATSYKLFEFYRHSGGFHGEQIHLLILGNIVAFLVALLAIKTFITYLQKHGFVIFGIYRIIAALIILLLHLKGIKFAV